MIVQLKTIGESLDVTKTINDIINKSSDVDNKLNSNIILTNRLAKATKKYSLNAIKTAIAESTLDETQIKAILEKKGLKHKELETTTAELAEVTSNNAIINSEKSSDDIILKITTAFKGLAVSIKALAVSHPILLGMTVALGAIAGAAKIVDTVTVSIAKQRKAFENAQQAYSDTCTKLEDLQNEATKVRDRISELQSKYNNGTITLVEQSELDKLKLTNEELKLEIQNQEELKKLKAKSASDEAYKTYIRENRMYTDDTNNTQEQYYKASSDDSGFHVGSFLDRASELSDFDYAIKANEQKLAELQKQNEELQHQFNTTSDENLKAQYQHNIDFNNNLISNYANSNEKLKESAKNMAEETFSDKIEKFESFKKTLLNSMNTDGTFDNSNHQQMWNDIQKKEMDLYKYSGKSAEWNTVKLDTIINDKSYNSIIDKLKPLLNEGSLTENDINCIDILNDKLNNTDLILEDGQSSTELFIEYLNKLKESGNEVFDSMTNSFTDLTELLTETNDKSQTANLADLQLEADLLSTIQKELDDNGHIGVSSMQSIINKYPEAKAALSDYMQGIISEQELFSQLEKIYDNDKNQYIQSVVDRSQADEDFFNTIRVNYPELFNELANIYGNDVSNWTNLQQAKVNIAAEAVEQIARLYQDFYAAIGVDNGADFHATVYKNTPTKISGTANPAKMGTNLFSSLYSPTEFKKQAEKQYPSYSDLQKNIDNVLKKASEMKDKLDKGAYDQIKSSIDLDWKGMSGYDSSNSSGNVSDSSPDSSSEPSPQDFNWVERILSKISKVYDRLKNKVSDTTRTWLNRNNALSDSMETLLSEINAQSNAYDFYMDRFNSYDLSDYYKDQIANGSFNIETIYDDDLKDAISDCKDLYNKAQDAADAVQSLNIELRELAKTRFDNIQSQFESHLDKITAIRDLYSKEDDILQEKGWFSSTLLNNAMIEQEQKNLNNLETEKDALVKALNSAVSSGKIAPESEDWYSMQSAIDEVSSSIYDSKKALIEYDNAIRQINWDAFDRTTDTVNNLIDETQFLVDLLKNESITDDNGAINDNGNAAQALIAQKYQLYLNQAKNYKNEILKINKAIANDPYDKELLDRRQELINAQQEAINSSISEKDALKDLVSEGYNKLKENIDSLIQKFKDMMSSEKDAFDYAKSISEKTKALNTLEKQYSAVQGDNSEEGKKNLQQLKEQIDSAKEDLSNTEYEKLISDTEKLLDELQDNTQIWIDERLDNFDITMQEIIEQSNANAENISNTITSAAESYGYKLSESMSSIWSSNTNNITSVLGDFSNKFVEGNNAINKICNDINSAVQGLLANSNAEAQRIADEIAKQQAEQNANTDGGYSDGGGSSSEAWSDNWNSSDSGSSSNSDGVNWIYSPDSYPKDLLNIENSIVDRLKYNDFDSSFSARAGYYKQITGNNDYFGTADQNILLLNYLKSTGYRRGTNAATSGIHMTDEQNLGAEAIISTKYGTLRQLDSGDTVFNKEQVQKLWNLSKGITTPNMYINNLGANLPDIPNMSSSLSNKIDVTYGDLTFSFPNVKNYEDFMKQAQKDPKFEKMVQSITFGQTLGKNSLDKLTF